MFDWKKVDKRHHKKIINIVVKYIQRMGDNLNVQIFTYELQDETLEQY